MRSRAHVLLLLLLLADLSTACGAGSSPTTALPDADAPAPVPAPTGFPALTRPGQVFRALGAPTEGDQLISRYVLYDDRTFALQYYSPGHLFEYRGTYTDGGSTVTFLWGGASAENWLATGTLRGDELRVHYNAIMQQFDFVDATYQRVAGSP
jgi:hypothetical protein